MASVTKQRKVAANFRDVQLFEIFQLTIAMLQTALDQIATLDDVQVSLSLVTRVIPL